MGGDGKGASQIFVEGDAASDMQHHAQLKQQNGGAAPGLEPRGVGRQREHHAAKPEANEGTDCCATQRCEEALHMTERRPSSESLALGAAITTGWRLGYSL